MTFQGSSNQTTRKEFGIEGVSYMRFNQFKSLHFRYEHVICADVFSGTGKNEVGGEIVDGSPLRVLNAFLRSKNTRNNFNFFFSDIRQAACTALQAIVHDRFGLDIHAHALAASDAINLLGDALQRHKNIFLYLVLDPNGPKDFPKSEVEDLLRLFPRRIDIVPYISATSVNRCIAARNKAGVQFKGWLGEIENFDQGFVSSLTMQHRQGWIRKPVESDPQRWTMIPTFGCMKPRNDWEKQGFIDLSSEEGKEIVKFYCGGVGNGN